MNETTQAAIDDGGPAFPYVVDDVVQDGKRVSLEYHGMSLRDWFAGAALQGVLADPTSGPSSVSGGENRDGRWYATNEFIDHVGTTAYQYADAMLAARKAVPHAQ